MPATVSADLCVIGAGLLVAAGAAQTGTRTVLIAPWPLAPWPPLSEIRKQVAGRHDRPALFGRRILARLPGWQG